MLWTIAVILWLLMLGMVTSYTLRSVPAFASVPRYRGRADQHRRGPPADLNSQWASKIRTSEKG
jgi:hypothetical protein